MNLEILEKYVGSNNYHLDFLTDGIGMTWGVSYVRLTVGEKRKFDNIEHFFFSTIMSEKNMTSGIYGQPTWINKVDLKEWAKKLKVKEIDKEEITQFINLSLNEIKENEKYWPDENTIDISFLDVTKEYNKPLLINETIFPRHYINTTDIYLTSDYDYYYYFEGHWES